MVRKTVDLLPLSVFKQGVVPHASPVKEAQIQPVEPADGIGEFKEAHM
jgi:hypothetical protein